MKYLAHNTYLRQDQVLPNWKDILLVAKVCSWLSPLWLVLEKNFAICISFFVGPGNLRGNLQGSKCDGDCIFLRGLFPFYEKVPPILKYFYPNPE